MSEGMEQTGATAVGIGIPELKGHYYIYGVRGQVEKFLKTTRAIAEYVGTAYGKEMWTLIDKKEEAKFTEPDPPADLDDRAEMKKFEMKLKRVLDKEDKYQENKAKVFRIIIGQCEQTMKGTVERADGFGKIEKKDNVIGLLGKI
jgi:hypothetical protein